MTNNKKKLGTLSKTFLVGTLVVTAAQYGIYGVDTKATETEDGVEEQDDTLTTVNIKSFKTLNLEITNQTILKGKKRDDIEFPKRLLGTDENDQEISIKIKNWELTDQQQYNDEIGFETNKIYTFQPVLSEKYILSEGVEKPTINISCEEEQTKEETQENVLTDNVAKASADTPATTADEEAYTPCGEYKVYGGNLGADFAMEDGVFVVRSSTSFRIVAASDTATTPIVVKNGVKANFSIDNLSLNTEKNAINIQDTSSATITIIGTNTLTSQGIYATIRVEPQASIQLRGTAADTLNATAFRTTATTTYYPGTAVGGNGTNIDVVTNPYPTSTESCGTISFVGGNYNVKAGSSGTYKENPAIGTVPATSTEGTCGKVTVDGATVNAIFGGADTLSSYVGTANGTNIYAYVAAIGTRHYQAKNQLTVRNHAAIYTNGKIAAEDYLNDENSSGIVQDYYVRVRKGSLNDTHYSRETRIFGDYTFSTNQSFTGTSTPRDTLHIMKNADVTINSGVTVTTGYRAIIEGKLTNNGTYTNTSASTMEVSGQLIHNGNMTIAGILNNASGLITVNSGKTLTTSGTVYSSGNWNINGTLQNNGSFYQYTGNINGSLSGNAVINRQSAGNIHISGGDLVIDSTGYTLGSNAHVNYSGDYTVSGETELHNIVVKNGAKAKITLSSVRINTYTSSAIDIEAGGEATLVLQGTNYLATGKNYATIHVPWDATLNIDGSGTLYGYDMEYRRKSYVSEEYNNIGAVIGGHGGFTTGANANKGEDAGNINFKGGSVYINIDTYNNWYTSNGIGGGRGNSTSGQGGFVTTYGGYVNMSSGWIGCYGATIDKSKTAFRLRGGYVRTYTTSATYGALSDSSYTTDTESCGMIYGYMYGKYGEATYSTYKYVNQIYGDYTLPTGQSYALNSYSYVIKVNSGATMHIPSGITISPSNRGMICNNGTIDIDGGALSIGTDGYIYNSETASIIVEATSTLTNNSVIKNIGTNPVADLTVKGKMNNYGSASFNGNISIESSGTITNTGTLDCSGTDNKIGTLKGTITNKGALTFADHLTCELTADGKIENSENAIWNNGSMFTNNGSITNNGKLVNQGTIDNTNAVVKMNNGVIQNYGSIPVPFDGDGSLTGNDEENGEFDITNADLTIDATGYRYGGGLHRNYTGDYKITGTAINHRLIIDNSSAKILLDNVSITHSQSGIDVKNGTANIELIGKNSVTISGDNTYAAVHVPSGRTLNLTGSGSLTAKARTSQGSNSSMGGGAGIGGNGGNAIITGGSSVTGEAAGVIKITNCTVEATGGAGYRNYTGSGAGIGGGGGTYYNSNNVASGGNGGSVTITDASVIATEGIHDDSVKYPAYGIGSGGGSPYNQDNGTYYGSAGYLYINGANIRTTCIHPTAYKTNTSSRGVVITSTTKEIYGDMTLTENLEITSDESLTIGASTTLTVPSPYKIINNGQVIVDGKLILQNGSAYEGTGEFEVNGGTITSSINMTFPNKITTSGNWNINNNAKITFENGFMKTRGTFTLGSGTSIIHQGESINIGDITFADATAKFNNNGNIKTYTMVSSSNVTGHAFVDKAAIGEYDITVGSVVIRNDGTVNYIDVNGTPYNIRVPDAGQVYKIIGKSESTTNTVTVNNSNANKVELVLSDVNITAEKPIYIGTNNTVQLTLEGDSQLQAQNLNAGILVPPAATLIIDGEGSIVAKGASRNSSLSGSGAGIGGPGGYSNGDIAASCGNVIINGGYVKAIAGTNYSSSSAIGIAAGIGGGSAYYQASYQGKLQGKVTINGGTVEATPATSRGWGIGSGAEGSTYGNSSAACANGNIVINGGNLQNTTLQVDPVDKDGHKVYKTTVKLPTAYANQTVTSVSDLGGYGINQMRISNDASAIFYLPTGAATTKFTLKNGTVSEDYLGYVKENNSNTLGTRWFGTINVTGTFKNLEKLTASVTPDASETRPIDDLTYGWYRINDDNTETKVGDGLTYIPNEKDFNHKLRFEASNDSLFAGSYTTAKITKGDSSTPTNAKVDDEKDTVTFKGTPKGRYEYSTDGGATWSDAPDGDENGNFTVYVGNLIIPGNTIYIRGKGTSGQNASTAYIEASSFTAVMKGTVSISGTLKYDQILTASISGAPSSPAPNIKYTWYRNDGVNKVTLGNGTTYKLVGADIGKTITVTAEDTNNYYGGTVEKTTTTIAKADTPNAPALSAVTYSPTKTVSQQFTLPTGWTWADTDKDKIPTVADKSFKANYNDVNGNYTSGSNITVNVTINKATPPAIVWPSSVSEITYEEQLNKSTFTDSDSMGSFAWTNKDTVLTAGTHTQELKYTPTDSANYDYSSVTQTKNYSVKVNKKAVTSITLPTAKAITYGDTLSTSVLTNTDTHGTFAWTNGTQVLDAGTHSVSVTYTPTDESNYDFSSITKVNNISLVVNQAAKPTITFPSATSLTYGQSLSDSTLSGGTSGYGTYTWKTPTTAPKAGNNQEFDVVFTVSDAAYKNYAFDAKTYTQKVKINVAKATPPVITWPTASTITYGDKIGSSALSSSDTYGTFAWVNGDEELDAGTYLKSVRYTPKDTDNYDYTGVTLTQNISITVEKAEMPTIVWPTASDITYLQALSQSVLSTTETNNYGTFAWEKASDKPNAGTASHKVIFTPSSSSYKNYKFDTSLTYSSDISVTVKKATPPAIIWPQSASLIYGQKLNECSLFSADAYGTFAWKNGETKLNAGNNQTQQIVYTPKDTDNYDYSKVALENSITVNVSKATPEAIAWPMNGEDITYGDKLSASVLNSSDTKGTFTWVNGDEELEVGTYQRQVQFTPFDTDNYHYDENDLVKTMSVTVNKAKAPDIVWPTASDITYLQELKQSVLMSTDDYGSFVWKDGSEKLNAGTYQKTVVYTPKDTKNYDYDGVTLEHEVTVKVNKAVAPAINWPTASDITYKDQLKESSLSHESDGHGSFAWQDPDILLEAGDHKKTIVYTPDDTDNYNYVMVAVQKDIDVHVNQAVPETIIWPTASDITYLQELKQSVLTSTDAYGSFTWKVGNEKLKAGDNQKRAVVYTPNDSKNYNYTNIDLEMLVDITVHKAAAPEIQWPSASDIIFGDSLKDSILTSDDQYGSFSWSQEDKKPVAGNQQYEVIYQPKDTDNYDYSQTTLTKEISIHVYAAKAPEIQWPTAKDITYGQLLKESMLISEDEYGSFAWKNGEEKLNAGIYQKEVIYTPKNLNDYDYDKVALSQKIKVSVQKAEPAKIQWPTASSIEYGQTLQSSQLESSDKNGTFKWENETKTLFSGKQLARVVYQPQNTYNYDYTDVKLEKDIDIDVQKSQPLMNLEVFADKNFSYGDEIRLIATTQNAYSNQALFPTGKMILTDKGITIKEVPIISGKAEYTYQPDAGEHRYAAYYVADQNSEYKSVTETTFAAVNVDFAKASQKKLQVNNPTKVTYGDKNFTLKVTGGSGEGKLNYQVTGAKGVVQVSNDGHVKIIGTGQTIITVTKDGDKNYNETKIQYHLTVESQKLDSPVVKWDHDNNVISWDAVDNAKEYKVIIYKDGKPFKEIIVTNALSFDLMNYIDEDGQYSVQVEALGDGHFTSSTSPTPKESHEVKPSQLERQALPEQQNSMGLMAIISGIIMTILAGFVLIRFRIKAKKKHQEQVK